MTDIGGKFINCEYCNKTIYRISSRLKAQKHHFCNYYCSSNWRKINQKGENSPVWRRKTVPCDQCGKLISRPPSLLKHKNIFCDRFCLTQWKKENLRGKNGYNWSGGKLIPCRQCKKEIYVIPSKLKQINIFCSRICMGKWMSENLKGESSPTWLGGISTDPYGVEFNNKLKKQIRERDNFACQECGCVERQLKYKLRIHHIDFNKQNSSPYNLISLCRLCHAQTLFNRKSWIAYYQNKMLQRISGGKISGNQTN